MKKIAYLCLLLLLSLAACRGTKNTERLSHEKDSLMMVVAEKDSIIDDVFNAMNAVADNFRQIRTRENIIDKHAQDSEIRRGTAAQINEDMAAISRLLEENRATIARLQLSAEALRKSNVQVEGMEKMIAQLQRQVEEKDREVARLRQQLQISEEQVAHLNRHVENLDAQVTNLAEQREILAGEVKTATDNLYTAYYIVGSEKELLDKEIVYKSGFIGRTLKINQNRSLDSFTQVDTRSLEEVIIDRKKVTLVSTHPEGSYEWLMDADGWYASLRITDRERFWESSKILVIGYK